MKTLQLVVIGAVLLISSYATKAQVSVQVNFGSPPSWGPVGYTDVRYYYLPAVQAYYDIQSSTFIYYSGSVWVRSGSLPGRYRNYDLYNGYKVVMTDYHGDTPYMHFKTHKQKYSKSYRVTGQKTIGQKPGSSNSGSGKSGKSGGEHGKKKGKGN